MRRWRRRPLDEGPAATPVSADAAPPTEAVDASAVHHGLGGLLRPIAAGDVLCDWEYRWLQGPQRLCLRPLLVVSTPDGEQLIFDREGLISFAELLALRTPSFERCLQLLAQLCRMLLISLDQLLDLRRMEIGRDSLFFERPAGKPNAAALERVLAAPRLLYLPCIPLQRWDGPDDEEAVIDGICYGELAAEESAAVADDGSGLLAPLIEDLLQHEWCDRHEQARKRTLLNLAYEDCVTLLAWLDEQGRGGAQGADQQTRETATRVVRATPSRERSGLRQAATRLIAGQRGLVALFALQGLLLVIIQQLIQHYRGGADRAYAYLAVALLLALIALDLTLLIRSAAMPAARESELQRRWRLEASAARHRELRARLAATEAGTRADDGAVFACLYDVSGDAAYAQCSAVERPLSDRHWQRFLRQRTPMAVLMHNSCYLGSDKQHADVVLGEDEIEGVRLRFRRMAGHYRLCDLGGHEPIWLDERALEPGLELTLDLRHELRLGRRVLLYVSLSPGGGVPGIGSR